MYEFITGKLAELTPTYAVVENSGIGYLVNISLNTFSKLDGYQEDEIVKLYLHYVIREDVRIFYGFVSKLEREMFQYLISVSGIGASTARMILSTYTPSELRSIILSDNAHSLQVVKGLGTKGAQKIIVELRDKILKLPISDEESGVVATEVGDNGSSEEALAALVMLGFSKAACKKVVTNIAKTSPTSGVEEIIRLALKSL